MWPFKRKPARQTEIVANDMEHAETQTIYIEHSRSGDCQWTVRALYIRNEELPGLLHHLAEEIQARIDGQKEPQISERVWSRNRDGSFS